MGIVKCLFNITIILLRQAVFDCFLMLWRSVDEMKAFQNIREHRTLLAVSYIRQQSYTYTRWGGGLFAPLLFYFLYIRYKKMNTI